MFNSPLLRILGATIAASVLLSGCSINGSYPDATEPDAAKLRFISDLESASLDVFDAEHCMGRTTGLLNNLFVANTRRRAAMTITPQNDDKAYLEVRLKPESNLFLRANMVSTGVVCNNSLNVTLQRGAEYELTFDFKGNQCQSSLMRLHQAGNKVVRSPVPLINKGLPACAGSNALFPKAAETQPDTAERTAMIDQIIADSLIEEMQPETQPATPVARSLVLNKAIAEREKQMGFTMPEPYWLEYRQNMTVFTDELTNSKVKSLQLYKDKYRHQLRQLYTAEIRKLLPDSATTDVSLALSSNNTMLQYYHAVSREVLKEAFSSHQTRMADLDKRYAVCERFAGCWKN